MVFGAGSISSVVIPLGGTLTAGAAIDTFKKGDPCADQALIECPLPASGANGLIMTALFPTSIRYAILAIHSLPRLTGWVVPILTVLAAATIYRGNSFMDATNAGGESLWRRLLVCHLGRRSCLADLARRCGHRTDRAVRSN